MTSEGSTDVCITTNQPDTKSNTNPTAEQRAVVNIQLNMVTFPMYPEKLIRNNVVAPFVPTAVSLSHCRVHFLYGCHTHGLRTNVCVLLF